MRAAILMEPGLRLAEFLPGVRGPGLPLDNRCAELGVAGRWIAIPMDRVTASL